MSAPRRRLLVIGAGIEQVRAYELAREMGLEVVGTDRNSDAPAFAHADHRIVADTHDADASIAAALAFHRERPLSGVMTVAHDVPLTVARVAEALDLPHLSVEAAGLAIDKLAMKERFRRDGVPVPRFRRVASTHELGEAIDEWGLPVVTKPIDSCGARGVVRITEGFEPEEAFALSLAASPRGVVIAEEYLSGMQLSTEGLALDGRTTTVAWAERYYDRLEEFAPYVIETGGLLSARLDEGEVRAVCEVMDRAARSLGIADGPVKGDLVMTERGPVVIELAARLSGGWFCTHQIPRARGVDLVRQTIRLALGERPDPAELVAEQRCFLSGRYFFPRPGVVESIEGYDELAAEPWVFRRVLHVEPGDEIAPTTSHPSRAGCVFTTGDTAEEAEARALACVERIRIVTRPLAPHSAAPGTSPAAPRP